MVRKRPRQLPVDRLQFEHLGAARDRAACYKGSGIGERKRVDGPPGEGEGPLPERSIRVPPLRAERRVHQHQLRWTIELLHSPHNEIHVYSSRGRRRLGRSHEGGVHVHPDDGAGAEERRANGEATGPAAEIHHGPILQSVETDRREQEIGRRLRRRYDLLEFGPGAGRGREPVEKSNKLRTPHGVRTEGRGQSLAGPTGEPGWGDAGSRI